MSLEISNRPAPQPTKRPLWLNILYWAIVVPFARLRFVMILGVIGLAIAKWDLIRSHYERWVDLHTHESGSGDHEYFCPMHPSIVRPTSKEKCPICKMPLARRKLGETSNDVASAGNARRVQLTPYRLMLAGVNTSEIQYRNLTKEIRCVGTVEFDERELRNVTARVKGRIEKLLVNQTGQLLHEGDAIAEVYSPELIITMQNLLDAKSNQNDNLMRSARERLSLWGIDEKQIDDVIRTGKPTNRFTIRSPIDGHVTKRYVREGQMIEEGALIIDVADLRTVWVQAQLYEEDMAFLPKTSHDPTTGYASQPIAVKATTRAYPGREFDGNLTFIYPHIDQETRTIMLRFELKNPEHELRPGMSATVRLQLTLEEIHKTTVGKRFEFQDKKVLAVPESSVIDTGTVQLVYRQHLPGVFDGIPVELGPRMQSGDQVDYFPVLKGLSENDIVVTSGSFLIDAETRLNLAIASTFIGGNNSKSGNTSGSTPIRPSTPEDQSTKIREALAKLSQEDRKAAIKQYLCPITGDQLGSMDVPIKVTLEGQTIFLCCPGCRKEAQESPKATLEKLAQLQIKSKKSMDSMKSMDNKKSMDSMKSMDNKKSVDPKKPLSEEEMEIEKNLAALKGDRPSAEKQKFCPSTGEPLGSMGVPIKLLIENQPVWICCAGCKKKALANPKSTLEKVNALLKQNAKPMEGKR